VTRPKLMQGRKEEVESQDWEAEGCKESETDCDSLVPSRVPACCQALRAERSNAGLLVNVQSQGSQNPKLKSCNTVAGYSRSGKPDIEAVPREAVFYCAGRLSGLMSKG
jgi:hypothetical protein